MGDLVRRPPCHACQITKGVVYMTLNNNNRHRKAGKGAKRPLDILLSVFLAALILMSLGSRCYVITADTHIDICDTVRFAQLLAQRGIQHVARMSCDVHDDGASVIDLLDRPEHLTR